MDQKMTQLLTEKLGAGLQSDDLSPDALQSLISNQFSDPMMAALATSMLSQNTTKDKTAAELVRYKRKVARAKQVIQLLKQHLEDANVMLNYISEVFGVCPFCWGQDQQCDHCHGRGYPGSGEPVEEELLAWAVPALGKLDLQVVRNGKQQAIMTIDAVEEATESDTGEISDSNLNGRPTLKAAITRSPALRDLINKRAKATHQLVDTKVTSTVSAAAEEIGSAIEKAAASASGELSDTDLETLPTLKQIVARLPEVRTQINNQAKTAQNTVATAEGVLVEDAVTLIEAAIGLAKGTKLSQQQLTTLGVESSRLVALVNNNQALKEKIIGS